MKNDAYVTLLDTDAYLMGTLILAQSVQRHCKLPLYVLTGGGLSERALETLACFKIPVLRLEASQALESAAAGIRQHGGSMAYWAATLRKLQVFELTHFEKMVYLDSDMLVCACIDALFDKPHMSAVPDVAFNAGKDTGVNMPGFNSGLMVIEPMQGLAQGFSREIARVSAIKALFGDQEVLNLYYCDWRNQLALHLDASYNACAYRLDDFKADMPVYVQHFIGSRKPWNWTRAHRLARMGKYTLQGRGRCMAAIRACWAAQREIERKAAEWGAFLP